MATGFTCCSEFRSAQAGQGVAPREVPRGSQASCSLAPSENLSFSCLWRACQPGSAEPVDACFLAAGAVP